MIKDATPGARVQAYVKGRKKLDLALGKTYPLYDLASLTKVISATTLLMHFKTQKAFQLTDSVAKYLPWFPGKTAIKHHLNHTSGAIWWQPFYKTLRDITSQDEKWVTLQKLLRNEKFNLSSKATYSDVGFLVLGPLIEALSERPLYNAFELVQEEFRLSQTGYHINNVRSRKKTAYAPTEKCEWRHMLLQGEVHDDNAYSLGGVFFNNFQFY